MDLVKSASISDMLIQRAKFISSVEESARLIKSARDIYEQSPMKNLGKYDDVSFPSLASHRFSFSRTSHEDLFDEKALLAGYDARAWKYLMIESGLQTFMSSGDISKWEESIFEKSTPPLTLENIEATFAKLHGERGVMLENGVLSLFKGLSWDHKTNNPVRFGKKAIISLTNGYGSVVLDSARLIDDLIRFMHVADSQPQPDHRDNFAIKMGYGDIAKIEAFHSDYIGIKAFKNGNAHIIFKRADLVDKMNLIVAKHHPGALPAPK